MLWMADALRESGIPFNAWAREQSETMTPGKLPLKWRHVGLNLLSKDTLTPAELGLKGRAPAEREGMISADLEWWAIVKIPRNWGELVTAGQIGTPKPEFSADTKGGHRPTARGSMEILVGLPHTWEPPPGEIKAAETAKAQGRTFLAKDRGYTAVEFAEHMHRRIWSKTLQRKTVRWKAHIRQYEESYARRFGARVKMTPVRWLGFAVRLWL